MPGFVIPFRGERLSLNQETRRAAPGVFIELQDGSVHYQLGGPADGPPVVLLHGFSVPFYIWDSSFEALVSAGCRVLRFDFFGRGYSDRPHTSYDRSLFLRQTLNLIEALEFPQPFHMAGISMGGIIAAEVAVHHPDRAGKLVLIDPAGFPLDLPILFKLVRIPLLGEVLLNMVGPQTLLKFMASDIFEPRLMASYIEPYRIQMQFKGFFRAILSTLRSGVLEDALPTYRRLAAHAHPILLIWGRLDETVPFKFSQRLTDALPSIQFHPIDDAGHVPQFERPEAVNPLLVEFLRAG